MLKVVMVLLLPVAAFLPPWLAFDARRIDLALLWLFGVVPCAMLLALHLRRPADKIVSWRAFACLAGLVAFGCSVTLANGIGALFGLGGVVAFLLCLPKSGGWYVDAQ